MSALEDMLVKSSIETETEPSNDVVAPQKDDGEGVATNTEDAGGDGEKADDQVGSETATTEATDPKESLPEGDGAKVDKVDKSKLTRQEKADYAWKKLTHKNSVANKKIRELESQLKEAREIAELYKSKGDFANYVELHENTKVLEDYKRELEDDVNSNPTELREAQAESIWDGEDAYDKKILDTYKTYVMPRSGQLLMDVYRYVSSNVSEDVARNVCDYIKNSDNNPVLELALSTRDIQTKVLDSMCRSTDPRKIWLDCSKVESNLIKQMADLKAKNTTSKPSSRSTGSVVSNTPNRARNLDDVRELSDAEMDALLRGRR